jgi:GDP-L-fucose synthase
MNKNSKIYIAGHRGLVGSALLRNLQAAGYTNIITRTHAELELLNQQAVNDFFADEKPEYVFLAAAKVGGIMANNTYRADFIYENLQVQNNVIHASYQNQVKKLLFLGSSCIYPKNAPQPLKEEYLLTSELEYTNEPYAIAKIAGIKLCESYNIQYGTNFIAVMPTNLYGPNDNFDLESSHVLPAMIRKMHLAKLLDERNYQALADNLQTTQDPEQIKNQLSRYGISQINNTTTLKLWGSGMPYREFLHVDDMADACIFVMNNIDFNDLINDSKEIRNTHINIGTGTDLTIKDLAYLIKTEIGYKGIIEFDTSKPDGTMKKLQDVSKLASLGWQPKIDLVSGLRSTIDCYLKLRINHGQLTYHV